LNDNENYTVQIITYISTALPNVTKLDMRDCPNINLSKSMQLMENMKFLEHLYLGPTNIKMDTELFVEGNTNTNTNTNNRIIIILILILIIV